MKVNALLMRGVNDDEAPALLRWCLDRGYEMRFIEQMPLDAQHGWDRAEMVTADEILRGSRPSSTSTRSRTSTGAARRRRPGSSTGDRAGSASSGR